MNLGMKLMTGVSYYLIVLSMSWPELQISITEMDYLEKMSEFQSSAKDDFIISDSMALIFKCINNSKFVQYSSEL